MNRSRWCPVCRREWPLGQVGCADCLVELVEDPMATVHCRHCDRECPATMQSCPSCLGVLRVDPIAAAEALAETLALGGHLFRPAGPAFAGGPGCTLLRLAPRGRLAFTGSGGLVEATVEGPDVACIAPLICRDLDGSALFLLTVYEATSDALVAIGADGAALGTFLWVESGIDVRDETSAPVGSLRVARGGLQLVETGGGVLASCIVTDVEQKGWVDDQWTLQAVPGRSGQRVPLQPLAVAALLLAAKTFRGRAVPSPVARTGGPDDRPLPAWLA